MDNSIYNKALEAIIGEVGNFVEPTARMFIEGYNTNPVLHPISVYKANQAEDKFRDAVASMNLLEENLKDQPVLFYCRDSVIALGRQDCEKIEIKEGDRA